MKTILVFHVLVATVNKINAYITQKNTGTIAELAEKVGLVPETLKYYLIGNRKLLEEVGIRIIYDRKKRTYRFSKQGIYEISFSKKWKSLHK